MTTATCDEKKFILVMKKWPSRSSLTPQTTSLWTLTGVSSLNRYLNLHYLQNLTETAFIMSSSKRKRSRAMQNVVQKLYSFMWHSIQSILQFHMLYPSPLPLADLVIPTTQLLTEGFQPCCSYHANTVRRNISRTVYHVYS